MPSPDPDAGRVPEPGLDTFLHRPLDDRIREYKYRFAQSVVFGLPVVALQYLGPSLGGAESGRWVGLFQALLTGWIVYVCSGMLFEGVIRALNRRRPTADLVVILAAITLYFAGLVTWINLLLGRHWPSPGFHWTVLLILAWVGFRWLQLSRRVDRIEQ